MSTSFGKQDFTSSLVVFLVALPLSIGIALASGSTPEAGLIAATVGGIVVGFLGGAPLQVSGPAAGLTAMVFALIQTHGAAVTSGIVVLAGLLQLTLGALGGAQLTLLIAPAVIHAMLAGIGLLIALGQVHVFFGSTPKSGAWANLVHFPQTLSQLNAAATWVGVLSFALLYLWPKLAPKKLSFLPASLVAVIMGTAVASLLNLEVPRVQVGDHFLSSLQILSPSVLSGTPVISLLAAALGLGFVASAESLLCAIATDKLHAGPRADLNRELMAQGVGNSISGALGGLPITGVIVRSSANIASGAKTKWSAVLHGIWILLFASLFTGMLKLIPMSVLAALLIKIGKDLVKLNEVKLLNRYREAPIYLGTLFGVVFVNLLWGIGIGLALSILFLLYQLSRLHLKIDNRSDGIELNIEGALTFLSVPLLLTQLRSLPNGKSVKINAHLSMLDHAALDSIRSWKASYERLGGKVTKPSLDALWDSLR